MTFFRLIRRLLLVTPALLILLSCRADADTLPQTTVSPTAESDVPADTLTPTASPVPSPLAIENLRLLFVRHPTDIYAPGGELWISEGDGSNQRRLSPEGVDSAYAGKIRGKAGNVLVYFVAQDIEMGRTVWQVDADDGAPQSVFSFESQPPYLSAAVSPDAGHIAYIESRGLSLLNVVSGESRLLLASGDRAACLNNEISECHAHIAPQWSPDGRLLLATHALYEGGLVQVIDPFVDPPRRFIEYGRGLPSGGRWSHVGNVACAMGRYDRPSGLYLIDGPDWLPENRIPEYEEGPSNTDGRSVGSCAWVSGSEVAYLTSSRAQGEAEIGVLDVAADSRRAVVRFDDLDRCCSFGRLTNVDGGRSVVAQFPEHVGDETHWAGPQLVDIDTGESRPVLDANDLIVAAFMR